MAVEGRYPIDWIGAPFAVGMLSLLAAGLSFAIYATYGTWPTELGGWTVALFVSIAVVLIGLSWQAD